MYVRHSVHRNALDSAARSSRAGSFDEHTVFESHEGRRTAGTDQNKSQMLVSVIIKLN